MTYNVFGGTLNLTQLNSTVVVVHYKCVLWKTAEAIQMPFDVVGRLGPMGVY